jgi:hypothetical protein
MSALIEVGCGMQQLMLARASPKLLLLLFVSPTLKVSYLSPIGFLDACGNFGGVLCVMFLTEPFFLDANAFKDAFLKAQKDNEALFSASAGEEVTGSASAPAS